MIAFQVISIIVCSLLYPTKGGNLFHVKYLDGKKLSAIIFGVWCMLFFPWPQAALLGALWLAAVSPSMGEEAGAVGGYKGAWGPYIENPKFGRSYGVKKALQRGVWEGALLALILPPVPAILIGLTWPLAYYAGISVQQWRTNQVNADWHIAEFIRGAVLGGVFLFL